MKCPVYGDGVHCFVPGVLRTVTLNGEEMFVGDWHSCLASDHMLQPAKRCACGHTVRGVAKVCGYSQTAQGGYSSAVMFGLVQR